jgi:hypothetical protein
MSIGGYFVLTERCLDIIRASPDIAAKKTITCAEIIIALKKNGDIRKDELRKVNHCLRLWAGENSKLADSDADQDSEQSNELSSRVMIN